ncbi:hypothetical protein [Rhizobium mongolense]|uniref:hypothetical protein n=1 Tax=Rhizobium mongolense TaxID=57676 RepID=UPI001113EBBC|nr:hypothetical protein [Rhizobium mongolense]
MRNTGAKDHYHAEFRSTEGKAAHLSILRREGRARAANATEDRDFELAYLLGSPRNTREDTQILEDEIVDQEYEENN